ncbi:hypothetical protein HaLaN_18650 [Haematococcus lacustris]|uniref:Uncharacterized protein n=1 Tax=Haematococcus lacustris TaxID=44745 RepID=A0A699ZGM5_HAELA|nr:hypothetical protein HaLaN_18650 [Haematococcus lacustris]
MRASSRDSAVTGVAQEHLRTVRHSRRSQNDSHGMPNRCNNAPSPMLGNIRLLRCLTRWVQSLTPALRLRVELVSSSDVAPCFSAGDVSSSGDAPAPAASCCQGWAAGGVGSPGAAPTQAASCCH